MLGFLGKVFGFAFCRRDHMLKESALQCPKFSLCCTAGSQLKNTQSKLVMECTVAAIDNWWQIALQKTFYSQVGAILPHSVTSASCPDSL